MTTKTHVISGENFPSFTITTDKALKLPKGVKASSAKAQLAKHDEAVAAENAAWDKRANAAYGRQVARAKRVAEKVGVDIADIAPLYGIDPSDAE